MVAEKPSIASSIAHALSKSKPDTQWYSKLNCNLIVHSKNSTIIIAIIHLGTIIIV